MPRAVKRKLHKVVLYLECPAQFEEPSQWDWNTIVNADAKLEKDKCPVILHHAEPWVMGTA